ncbi:hypothetical protein PV350_13950 [Streptomyces sp. PA03-6a]|nr:hypothetical protein [Streptomyces sp. PA03-6a]
MLKMPELARHFNVSRFAIDTWIKRGCPVVRLPNGHRRFKLPDVEAWMKEQEEAGMQYASEKAAHAYAARKLPRPRA